LKDIAIAADLFNTARKKLRVIHLHAIFAEWWVFSSTYGAASPQMTGEPKTRHVLSILPYNRTEASSIRGGKAVMMPAVNPIMAARRLTMMGCMNANT